MVGVGQSWSGPESGYVQRLCHQLKSIRGPEYWWDWTKEIPVSRLPEQMRVGVGARAEPSTREYGRDPTRGIPVG